MFTVTISTKEVLGRLDDIVKNIAKTKPNITRDISYAYRDALRGSANQAFSYPRPNLSRRIISKKQGADWVVEMPVYGGVVDVGRGSGRMPPESPELKRWAAAAGINLFWLRRSIGRYGTIERPFIERGMADGANRTQEIISNYGNKIIGGKK
jgi:hypothetical protein